MIIENDVRLLRRYLVARQLGNKDAMKRLLGYLAKRDFKFILPENQTARLRQLYYSRLEPKEVALAEAYGCILLPEYFDCIFLNRDWENPKTLYVRLTEQVPELDELGYVVWCPEWAYQPEPDTLNFFQWFRKRFL